MTWNEVIFLYDGTFDGFICCVYESYTYKEFPVSFADSGESDPISFYPVRHIQTNAAHAQRVLRSLDWLDRNMLSLLYRAFLTCMPNKEIHLYALIRKLYQDGISFLNNPSDDTYYPVAKALRHLSGELEKLRGFIRFSDYSGVLVAEIEPKNRVLPLLSPHFCNRYANEQFVIFDRIHHEALVYSAGQHKIISMDSLQLNSPDQQEICYRTLWRKFYETIEIKERHNPKCQNAFLPKRYRKVMTEFQWPETAPCISSHEIISL